MTSEACQQNRCAQCPPDSWNICEHSCHAGSARVDRLGDLAPARPPAAAPEGEDWRGHVLDAVFYLSAGAVAAGLAFGPWDLALKVLIAGTLGLGLSVAMAALWRGGP